jgi:hypothetical protein
MRSQGHTRLAGQQHNPVAVQWWYFRDYEDGWAFARGGRVRTTREARKKIRDCDHECSRERHYFESRPTHEMLDDGSLVPTRGRSPYEAPAIAEHLR